MCQWKGHLNSHKNVAMLGYLVRLPECSPGLPVQVAEADKCARLLGDRRISKEFLLGLRTINHALGINLNSGW